MKSSSHSSHEWPESLQVSDIIDACINDWELKPIKALLSDYYVLHWSTAYTLAQTEGHATIMHNGKYYAIRYLRGDKPDSQAKSCRISFRSFTSKDKKFGLSVALIMPVW